MLTTKKQAPRDGSQLPENRELVKEFDRLLKQHLGEVRDYTCAFHRHWARRGVTTMRGTAWALRPFFLSGAHMDFVAAAFHSAMTSLRNVLRDAAARPGGVTKLLPYHPALETSINVGDGVRSAAFMSHFRPDGFLFEDRYVLSEVNYGNGSLVSCGYTEAVADYWQGHPVVKRLGWDVARLHRRPLPWLVNVARRFARSVPRPRVALVAHTEEWRVIEGYPRRVIDQMRFARDEMSRAGLRARLVTESDVVVDRRGQPRFEKDGASVDLVMLVCIGSSFLGRPDLLAPGGPLSHFGQARIGDTWVLKPLAGLLVDKGSLPLLGTLEFLHRMHDGFRFEVSPTEFAYGRDPARYRRQREKWVIKRAFDGMDTHVGVGRSPAAWRAITGEVVKDCAYVAQRYVSMPRADVPVFLDEKHLEWVRSRVELSSFIFDGAFGGAAARHAPDAEGLVMTDPPPDYGYSTVFVT